jgi:hypothetical protein
MFLNKASQCGREVTCYCVGCSDTPGALVVKGRRVRYLQAENCRSEHVGVRFSSQEDVRM